ncbi:hypothetical protein FRC12_020531 [Ceratobasidium sp. 428]|nr:hypothetical protein FRC12_020531 [Ceratobasidium sp. 428]
MPRIAESVLKTGQNGQVDMNASPNIDGRPSSDCDGINSWPHFDSAAHYSRRHRPSYSTVSLAPSNDLSFHTVPSIPRTFDSDCYEESISLLSIALSNDDPFPEDCFGFRDKGPQAFRGWPSLAAVLVQLRSIPPMPDSLTSAFQAVEGSRVGRKRWKQLQARCEMVARMTGARVWYDEAENYPRLQHASKILYDTIAHICERAKYWNQVSDLVAFVQFRRMREEISDYVCSLQLCYTRLSDATHLAQKQWVGEFEAIQRKRMRGLMDRMQEAAASSLDTKAKATQETFELLSRIMDENIAVLRNQTTPFLAAYTWDQQIRRNADAQRILQATTTVVAIQSIAQLLVSQQWIFNDTVLIKAGVTCDTYSAVLLMSGEVAKKIFKIKVSEREHVERYAHKFVHNAKRWAAFRSEYTIQLYGTGIDLLENGRHFQLYIVSPWMKNSDAVTYLKRHKEDEGMKEGIMQIITDAAKGLQYLHSREPPFVHAGMRGDNILVTDTGGGTLGGFGLVEVSNARSRRGKEGYSHFVKVILQNSVGNEEPLPAAMAGETESQRWTAPEMFAKNSSVLKTSSDVWGWAMAALELISGLPPYHQNKQPDTVMLDIQTKKRPLRAEHAYFEMYALKPDEMWVLLERCWAYEPEDRPAIAEVVTELTKMMEK